jgi:hypothetical protein
MSVRKVFSDENGKELSYQLDDNKDLTLSIQMADGTVASINMNKGDALQLIQELNKLRKFLSDR